MVDQTITVWVYRHVERLRSWYTLDLSSQLLFLRNWFLLLLFLSYISRPWFPQTMDQCAE